MKALAAYVAAGGSVADAAELVASGRAPSSATSPTCGRGRVSPRSSLSMWGELRDGWPWRAWRPSWPIEEIRSACAPRRMARPRDR